LVLGVDKDLALDLVDQGFGTDLAGSLEEMFYIRALAQAKVHKKAQVVEQMREFGFDLRGSGRAFDSSVPQLSEALGHLSKVKTPALDGYLFDRDVANILDAPLNIINKDRTIAAVARGIKTKTQWLKSWLILSPGFHFRNWQSNNFQGVINYGVKWVNRKHSFESVVATMYGLHGEEFVQKWAKKLGATAQVDDVLARSYNGKTIRELADEGAKYGVITKHVKGFDFVEMAEREAAGRKAAGTKDKIMQWTNVFRRDYRPIKVSHEIGSVIESVPRFQSFLLEYIDTGDSYDAILQAKKIFFDYEDLTNFEQGIMKTVIPFYTWTRKNLSQQFDQMTKMVEAYSLVPKIEDRMKSEEPSENLPDWMRRRGQFPIEDDIAKALGELPVVGDIFKGGKDLAYWSNLPYQDLNVIPLKFSQDDFSIPQVDPEGFVDEILQRAHPTLKSMVEVFADRDVFYKTELGDMRPVRGMKALNKENPYFFAALDGLLKFLGQKDGLPHSVDDKGDVELPGKLAVLIEENLPFFRTFSRIWDTGPLVDAVFKSRDEVYDEKQDEEGLSKRLLALSFYFGIKFNAYDPEKQRQRLQEDILREAEAERAKFRRNLPGYQAGRDTYWKNRNARANRLVR
jgi:hypothetical protein